MNRSLHESRQCAAWFLSSACLLCIAPCHADDGAVSEKDYLQDLPVVLSSSRLNQPLSETPNAVTVIDRGMIKASGFRTLSDVFRLVPGMFVGYVNGSFPIVAYHGAIDQYSRQMQVLVDGRSVYLPPTSSVDWEGVPLQIDDIERIEVVRGPAAASHGANSFQGVINIITRDASSMHGANVSVNKGDGGVSDVAAHFGHSGANFDYSVAMGYRADDGFDTKVINDNTNTRLINLRANYHPGTSDSLDFKLGYNEGTRGMGISGRPTDPFRDTSVHSSFEQLAWLHVLPQGDEFKLQYYHLNRNLTDPGGLALLPDHTGAHRHDLELQHTVQLGANNRLVWGGGMRTDSVDSPLNLKVRQAIKQSRLFAHDEWRVSPAAVLNVGAMFEKDGMGHANTSPRVSLNYHFTPHHTLRAGTSIAYRSPATLEEKINIPGSFVALGGLRPEKIISKELGYLGEFNSIGVTVDARTYIDRVSDVIFYDPTPLFQPPLFSVDGKPYSFRNLLSTSYRGAEATVKYRWSEGGNLTLNYARQKAGCSVTGSLREPLFMPVLQRIVSECSLMVPRNSGNILLTQQLAHDIQISAGYYHQEGLKIINTYMQPTMRRIDLRIAKMLGKSEKHGGGEIALVLQDLFQDSFSEYSAVPQTDKIILFNRRAYLTASFNF